MISFLDMDEIRKHAIVTLMNYGKAKSIAISFPIDVIDIFEQLCDLEVIYDYKGVINEMEKGIIGCLYPDGYPSPWFEKDKVIAINKTKPKSTGLYDSRIDPRFYNENFTIAHEGMHYILHFKNGILGQQFRRPIYCRANNQDAEIEFQANIGAGELLMPFVKVEEVLDKKKPPDEIDLDTNGKKLRNYFGASQAMVEARLHYLGYKLKNSKYEWKWSRFHKRTKGKKKIRKKTL